MVRIATLLALLALAAPLSARDSLGVFSNWAAFRDDAPQRCYAIAQPSRAGESAPFASVASWPGEGVRTQLHIRLSRAANDETDVVLRIGEERFTLTANGRNAWAEDGRMDAAVVAAMRSAAVMSVTARDTAGRRFTDRYNLAGAATAIDAALVACA